MPFVSNSADAKYIIEKILEINGIDLNKVTIFSNEISQSISGKNIINTLTKVSNKEYLDLINQYEKFYLFGDIEDDLKMIPSSFDTKSFLLNSSNTSNFSQVVGQNFDFKDIIGEIK